MHIHESDELKAYIRLSIVKGRKANVIQQNESFRQIEIAWFSRRGRPYKTIPQWGSEAGHSDRHDISSRSHETSGSHFLPPNSIRLFALDASIRRRRLVPTVDLFSSHNRNADLPGVNKEHEYTAFTRHHCPTLSSKRSPIDHCLFLRYIFFYKKWIPEGNLHRRGKRMSQ